MSATTHAVSTQSAPKQIRTNAEKKPLVSQDVVTIIGRIASVLSVIMYVSYIATISDNLAGHPGSFLQPLAAFFNCCMWTAYGSLKTKKDWPIIIANVPGIFLAATAVITTFIH